jgi:hypothetical protein
MNFWLDDDIISDASERFVSYQTFLFNRLALSRAPMVKRQGLKSKFN